MSDIILMDNFSSIAGTNQSIDASPWTRKRYSLFGRQPVARPDVVNNQWALTIPSDTTSVIRPSNALVTRLPNEFTRFGTGFFVRGYKNAPAQNPSSRGGSFAVGSIEGTSFFPILLIELYGPSLIIWHVEGTERKNASILNAFNGKSQFYIDYSFDKVSNVAGEMSNLTVFIDNQALLSGNYFNNAGTNLGIMHIGNISINADIQGGFLNELKADGTEQSGIGMLFGITDLWVTRNGRRYGKAVVSRTQASGTVGMIANVGDPLDIINQTVPNIDRNVYGKKLVADFTEHTNASASQITTLVQHNVPNQVANAELDFGTDTTQFQATNELELVRAGYDGAPNRAEMRIES